MALSLAISPCPNDTFVFDALVHGRVPGAPPVEVTYADVDTAENDKSHARQLFLRHRRPELYGEWIAR